MRFSIVRGFWLAGLKIRFASFLVFSFISLLRLLFLIFISSFVFDFYFWWKNCRGQASLRRLSPVFPIIDPPYKIVVLKKIKIFDII